LIHQRVRAAYANAKDPDVKERLKSALEYITMRKEASKEKTKLLKSKNEEWSQKYKNSINCNNPKGFSQRAHCAGKKK
jgi:hypothetical protein